MMDVIKGLLTSKKFVASVVGVIAWLVGKIGWDIDPAELTAMISPIIAYILGQGMADFGKEADKVNPVQPPVIGS